LAAAQTQGCRLRLHAAARCCPPASSNQQAASYMQ
jgi:hypothetical protein